MLKLRRFQIIVAVNKIDKPGADPEKIKQGLAELNLLAEDWGGDTMFIPVSALKKTNIDKLLDSILFNLKSGSSKPIQILVRKEPSWKLVLKKDEVQ